MTSADRPALPFHRLRAALLRPLPIVLAAVLLSAGLVSAQSAAVPAPGMIGWWPADGTYPDGFDLKTIDRVGGNDATLLNGAAVAAGYVTDGTGQAFSFDGVNDQLVVPHDASLDLDGAMSVSAWVNVADYACSDTRRVMSKLDVPAENGWSLGIVCDNEFNSAGAVRFAIFEDGTNHFVETTWPKFVPAGEWTHIGVTWDGETTLRLYIDGVVEHQSTWPAGTIGAIGTNTAPLTIGHWAGIYFKGLIDEPQLFDRALTTEQMAAIHDAGDAGTLRSGCPYAFTDPVAAIEDLVDTVETYNLHQGISNSLDAKLSSALGALSDLNDNNNGSAVNKLGAFLGEVEAQRGDELTDAQADELATCGTWAKWLAEDA